MKIHNSKGDYYKDYAKFAHQQHEKSETSSFSSALKSSELPIAVTKFRVKHETAYFKILVPDRTHYLNVNHPDVKVNFDEATIFCKRTNRFLFVLSVDDILNFIKELESLLEENELNINQFAEHLKSKYNFCGDYLRNSLFDDFLREFGVKVTVFDHHEEHL